MAAMKPKLFIILALGGTLLSTFLASYALKLFFDFNALLISDYVLSEKIEHHVYLLHWVLTACCYVMFISMIALACALFVKSKK